MNKNVIILMFSGRQNGNCAAIGNFIEQFYMRTNVHSFIIDGQNYPACGGCNYECLKQDQICPLLNDDQRKIMNTIIESDLVYFIVPNYCGYPCANYFAFNERSVGYFNMDPLRMDRYMSVTKRFIIVSNSEDHFAEAMQQQTNEIPDILYFRSSKYGKQSIAGDIMDSDEAKADLEAFLCNDRLL